MVIGPKVKAAAVLLLVFLLGGVAGAAVMRVRVRREMIGYGSEPGPRAHRMRMRALSRALDLDPEQEARVRDIFEKHRAEREGLMAAAMNECGAPLEAHRKKMDDAIRAILRPEQRAKFDSLKQRRRNRHGPRHRELP